MSTELKTQIRRLATQVEAGQNPVTVEEVRLRIDHRDDTEPVIGLAPPRRRMRLLGKPWYAALVAAAVVVLFGALALVLSSDDAAPPADVIPPPGDWEVGYYTTSAVPDGFVLQEHSTLLSGLTYLSEVDGTWLPSDGGFLIESPFSFSSALPDDLDAFRDNILQTLPGSTRVEVAGRPGLVLETDFSLDGITAPIVWVLGTDNHGGVFEISAVGMSRDDVLAVAHGVDRVPVDDFLALESQITWDLRLAEPFVGSPYSVPAVVGDVASDADVAIGIDVLGSRLAFARQDSPVITTDDGEVAETDADPFRARTVTLYVDASDAGIDELIEAFPFADLSPSKRDARVDWYVEQVSGGVVLSEDPYVIQVPPGPEPRFDTAGLGDELPLIPATSAAVVPESVLSPMFGDPAVATRDRPVIVMGTVEQPNSKLDPVTVLVWFTNTKVTCQGTATSGDTGSGCGFEILRRFGPGGESTSSSAEGVFGDVTYTVPLETSVVQIVTSSGTWWQRPVGGYGVVPFGDTVERPTLYIAYDADGNVIGEWEAEQH